MTACIFCQIADGIEPASVVYEDAEFIAFMDAYPLTKGHCLVLPKKHVVRLHELTAKERSRLFSIGHKLIEAQKKAGWGINGTNLLLNDGQDANQTVPHLHLHLIPRSSGDWFRALPKLALHVSGIFGLKASRKTLDAQAAEILAKIP